MDRGDSGEAPALFPGSGASSALGARGQAVPQISKALGRPGNELLPENGTVT